MGDEDPCDGALDRGLEIFRQSAASSKPGERALDDPTTWRDLEPHCDVGSFDDLDLPSPHSFERGAQFAASIAAVGEDMPQPRIERTDRSQRKGAAVAVLDISGVHDKPDQMAKRISNDMALASLDLLARVKAARTAAFRGLDGLAIDHAGGRTRLPPGALSRRHDEGMIDRRQGPVAGPFIEIAL